MPRIKFCSFRNLSVNVGFPSIPYTHICSGSIAPSPSPICFCKRPMSGFPPEPFPVTFLSVISRCNFGKEFVIRFCVVAFIHNGVQTSMELSTKYPIESPMFVPKSINVFLQYWYLRCSWETSTPRRDGESGRYIFDKACASIASF